MYARVHVCMQMHVYLCAHVSMCVYTHVHLCVHECGSQSLVSLDRVSDLSGAHSFDWLAG